MDALELAAVVYHDGRKVGSGHFWCACRNVDGRFWRFDGARMPSRVLSTDWRTKDRDVYMLVYTRPRGGECLCRRLERSSSPGWKQWGGRDAVRAGLVSKPGGGGDDARQPTEPGVREDTAKRMPTGQDQSAIVSLSAQATRAADARIVAELLVPEGPPRTHAPSGLRDQLAEPPETPAPARPLVI